MDDLGTMVKGKGRARDVDQPRSSPSDTVPCSTDKSVHAKRQRSQTVSSLDFATMFSTSESPRQDSVDSFPLHEERRWSATSSLHLNPSLHKAGFQASESSSPALTQGEHRFVTMPAQQSVREDWAQHGEAAQSPSSVEYRRSGHTRTRSSLGSGNTFDFFGPSSLASNSTAASSFGSPRAGSNTGFFVGKDQGQRMEDNPSKPNHEGANGPQTSLDDAATSISSHTPIVEPIEPESAVIDGEEQQQVVEAIPASATTIANPSVYAHDLLPSYEEAPAYSPSPSLQEASGSQTHSRNFRAAAADRFLSSRLAKKLNLPSALRNHLENLQTPTESPTRLDASTQRRSFNRSDSLPDLRSQRHIPRRLELHSAPFAGHANYRYTARPRDPAWGRRQPASSVIVVPRSQVSYYVPRGTYSQPPTVSSRRNSRESRHSNGTATSNGGFSTDTTRSGAGTPSQNSRGKRNLLRHLGLKSLGESGLLRRNRDRDSDYLASVPRPDTVNAAPSINALNLELVGQSPSVDSEVRRETVTSVTEETLISARIPVNSALRPSLLHAAYSSPQAGVTAELIAPSVFVSSTPSHFDQLPREIILTCFQRLVDLHVQDHQKAVDQGIWRGKLTTETKWVGLEAGVRELARLSRVSRSWQSYTLDGQLWQSIDYSVFPDISEDVMLKIARSAGSFVRKLDLHGMSNLKSSLLIALLEAQYPRQIPQSILQLNSGFIQLRDLDLEGCHQVSAQVLNQILSKSGHLKRCNISNMACVSNATLHILALNAQSLEVLKVNRCHNIDGEGLKWFFTCQLSRSCMPAGQKARNSSAVFQELHAAGVSGFDSSTLELLGRAWPNLKVLDLSYCSGVNDTSIAALVSSDGDHVLDGDLYVHLSPRQAGSRGYDEVIRRTFPSLKKLKLSSCRSLTDRACTELAHAVPSLEVLELANIGAGLKDPGLIKLLATVPHLQRLDLERATHITDAVLSALTPPESHVKFFYRSVPEEAIRASSERSRGSILGRSHRSISRRRPSNQFSMQDDLPPIYDKDVVAALTPATGIRLTHLILSSANKLTAGGMISMVCRLPFLRHFEVDDTRANNEVAILFVRLSRYRMIQNAYISMVDCRSFTRDTHSLLTNIEGLDGWVRPRYGQRGYAYRHFSYDDAEPVSVPSAAVLDSDAVLSGLSAEASIEAIQPTGLEKDNDECNSLKAVLKSFWGWQSVDARLRQKRKMEQRASKRPNKSRVGNVMAMAFGLPGADAGDDYSRSNDVSVGGSRPNRRWSRLLPSVGAGHFDDDDDAATGCTIM